MIGRIYSKLRRIYYNKILKKKYAKRVLVVAKLVKGKIYINNPSTVTSNTILGENVHFNGMDIFGEGKVIIGDNFHSGTGCVIITHYHNYDNGTAIPYDDTLYHKDVIIEDNVWLGNNVTIVGGVTIGEGAIIQIGSVVVSSIPPMMIAGGHPCRPYKSRNIEHYNKLKAEKKFN
ncbi:acetyltransferase-like isoleucine patch superfamily enzyme [Flavobacterium chryseum]|uniref:acyltransferase n=1 Tax=Flavobacterium sp. P3160 TaxID=2512113 RepID=UPI00105FA882|nr:acyltransferase [Flavobacterium sp. P3160]TDO77440.1 acetyltransferase-like isoleucine patch superfamily enzyme [Flavobacterium sp. P3160]